MFCFSHLQSFAFLLSENCLVARPTRLSLPANEPMQGVVNMMEPSSIHLFLLFDARYDILIFLVMKTPRLLVRLLRVLNSHTINRVNFKIVGMFCELRLLADQIILNGCLVC